MRWRANDALPGPSVLDGEEPVSRPVPRPAEVLGEMALTILAFLTVALLLHRLADLAAG